jgi:SAM-dependent methyltransferase
MTVFGNYSRYYDLLYRDKDYAAEAEFMVKLIKQHSSSAKRILELGCGTGKHAALLAEKGYEMHGVDRSVAMLEAAEARRQNQAPELQTRLQFSQGDVRDVQAGSGFDVVMSLFHVVSYQTTNDDLLAMFSNAHTHLKDGGSFIFDYWYGPAVLTDRPTERIKHMESDAIQVTRYAKPVMRPNESIVDVNYTIEITDKATKTLETLHETHHMRYLFAGEIELLARATGFKVQHACEWMTGKQPDFGTWGVCSILTK